MITDDILAAIDATLREVRRPGVSGQSGETVAKIYEQLGRKVCDLRGSSIAYRRSERRKGARIREALTTSE